MSNYSFVKTPEQLEALKTTDNGAFHCQEKLQIYWTIPEDVYLKLLPPGLEPVAPVAIAYVASFNRPRYFYPYSEGALFLLASNGGVKGTYCLAMPLDGNDQALAAGRELLGYPKKQAIVKLARRGENVEGYIERNGVRYFEVKAQIGEFNDPVLGKDVIGEDKDNTTNAGFCYLLNHGYNFQIVDQDEIGSLAEKAERIRLVRQKNVATTFTQEKATVEMIMRESEDDPWAELAPTKIIGAEYLRYETFMKGYYIVKNYETPEERHAIYPHLFARWDSHVFGSYHASYEWGGPK